MVLQVLAPGARVEGLEGHGATGRAGPVALAVRTSRHAYVARDHVLVELVGAHLGDSRLLESGELWTEDASGRHATRMERFTMNHSSRRIGARPCQRTAVTNASPVSGDSWRLAR